MYVYIKKVSGDKLISFLTLFTQFKNRAGLDRVFVPVQKEKLKSLAIYYESLIYISSSYQHPALRV